MNGVLIGGLGGAAGFGPLALPRNDDGSHPLALAGILSQGLRIGGATYDALWVNTNGTLSFGGPLAGHDTAALAAAPGPVLAVFAADVDTRLRGEGLESGQIWLHESPAAAPGGGALTATWAEVGFYRRNTDLVNSFQVRIQAGTAPGDADITVRYGQVTWVSGDLDGGSGGLGGSAALAGFSPGVGAAFLPVGPSGNELAWLSLGQPGGFAPVWTLSLRGGVASIAEGVPDETPPPPDAPGPEPEPEPGFVTGSIATRAGNPVAGVQLRLKDGGTAVWEGTTGADGSFGLPAGHAGPVRLEAFSAAAPQAALTPLDALQVLLIVAGIRPAAGLSPLDVISADYNGDGQVTALDALGILMHVARFAQAGPPQFRFVDAAALPDGIGLDRVPLPTALPGTDPALLHPGDTLQIVAILSGDLFAHI